MLLSLLAGCMGDLTVAENGLSGPGEADALFGGTVVTDTVRLHLMDDQIVAYAEQPMVDDEKQEIFDAYVEGVYGPDYAVAQTDSTTPLALDDATMFSVAKVGELGLGVQTLSNMSGHPLTVIATVTGHPDFALVQPEELNPDGTLVTATSITINLSVDGFAPFMMAFQPDVLDTKSAKESMGTYYEERYAWIVIQASDGGAAPILEGSMLGMGIVYCRPDEATSEDCDRTNDL